VWRKLIHVSSVVAAVAVWALPRAAALALLGVAVLVALGIEWARRERGWIRYQFLARTRRLLRYHERERFAGATFLAIGYFIAVLIFPRPVAVAAMVYGGLLD
jgi:dolichol kinase